MRCKLLIAFVLFFASSSLFAQTQTSVIVLDAETQSFINLAYIKTSKRSFTTHTNGVANIFLDADDRQVCINAAGYTDTCIATNTLIKNTRTVIYLKKQPQLLYEATVVATRKNEVANSAAVVIDPMQIKSMPNALGEKDILKTVALNPGFNNNLDGMSSLSVRGSNIDQNLILIDGIPIYTNNHFFGLYSGLPTQGIQQLDAYSYGYPAQYGGRAGSVLSVTMANASPSQWHGSYGFGVMSANFNINGPLIKDKLTLSISGRQSLLGLGSLILQRVDNQKLYVGFHDAYAKLNYTINKTSSLSAFVFYVRDRVLQGDGDFNSNNNFLEEEIWGNLAFGTTYIKQAGPWQLNAKLSTNGFAYNKTVEDNFTIAEFKFQEKTLSNFSINDILLQTDASRTFGNGVHTDIGIFANKTFASAPQLAFLNTASYTPHPLLDTTLGQPSTRLSEITIFQNINYSINPKLKLRAGIRTGVFFGNGIQHFYLDPRLYLQYSITQKVKFHFAIDQLHQALHQSRLSRLSATTDYMFLANANFLPTRTRQITSGAHLNLGKWAVFTSNIFYRQMHNVIERLEGVPASNAIPTEFMMASAHGRAYGVETGIILQTKMLMVNANYTYSQSLRQSDAINMGQEFTFELNQPHIFKIFTSIGLAEKRGRKREFGINWYYASGWPFSLPTQTLPRSPLIYFNQPFTSYFTRISPSKHNVNMPNMHRLDFNYRINIKREKGVATVELGVYNVYNQINGIFFRSQGGANYFVVGAFGVTPIITYSYVF